MQKGLAKIRPFYSFKLLKFLAHDYFSYNVFSNPRDSLVPYVNRISVDSSNQSVNMSRQVDIPEVHTI